MSIKMVSNQQKIDAKCRTQGKELENAEDQLMRVERTNKLLMVEQQKMKQKLTKIIARKGKFDQGIKTCKNCNKEYTEKDNFNWSCKTHPSEWGDGPMYWCCGKEIVSAPGCRQSRHVSGDNEDDDQVEKYDRDGNQNLANTKCMSCKEVGHSIEDCPRDPNIKRKGNAEKEIERIAKIQDFRKLHADT